MKIKILKKILQGSGTLVTQLKKSYSLTDLNAADDELDASGGVVRSGPKITDVTDDFVDHQQVSSLQRERTYSEGRHRASPMRQQQAAGGGDNTDSLRRRRQSPRKDDT